MNPQPSQPKIVTPVLTSRRADEHFEMVKGFHTDILNGIANQQIKIQQLNEQRAIQGQQQQQLNMQNQQMNADRNATMEKDRAQNAIKMRELEIKAAALAS